MCTIPIAPVEENRRRSAAFAYAEGGSVCFLWNPWIVGYIVAGAYYELIAAFRPLCLKQRLTPTPTPRSVPLSRALSP